jgi:hypothetical protein
LKNNKYENNTRKIEKRYTRSILHIQLFRKKTRAKPKAHQQQKIKHRIDMMLGFSGAGNSR